MYKTNKQKNLIKRNPKYKILIPNIDEEDKVLGPFNYTPKTHSNNKMWRYNIKKTPFDELTVEDMFKK
jgi:hypothetical protein